MTKQLPITHTILAPQPLAEQLWAHHALPPLQTCCFHHFGLNDTYLITTNDNTRFILRVYRHGWRSIAEIVYEVDVLNHLHAGGINVSTPLPRRDGGFVHTIAAPEGTRYAVLFTYAEGEELNRVVTADNLIRYGKTVARMHTATDHFSSNHLRETLDADHLITAPIKALAPYLVHRSADQTYLLQLADRMHNKLLELPVDQLEQGFCHGDLHGGNTHFASNGTVTTFDFDCGGPGWRAYDLAVFRWAARSRGKEQEYWEPFWRGYSSERSLNSLDHEAIPLFIGIRHLWLAGIFAQSHWGTSRLNDNFFDFTMRFFKAWEEEYLEPEFGFI